MAYERQQGKRHEVCRSVTTTFRLDRYDDIELRLNSHFLLKENDHAIRQVKRCVVFAVDNKKTFFYKNDI